MLGLADKDLIEFDLRIPNDSGQVIFTHLTDNHLTWVLPDTTYDFLGARESFCHVTSVDTQLDTLILTTTRKHLLLDKRMPGKVILQMGHAELDGADYCIMVNFFYKCFFIFKDSFLERSYK